jgi:peptidyl-prolyl cis-trans isomerase C
MKTSVSRLTLLLSITTAVMLFAACAAGAVFGTNAASIEPNKPEPNKPAGTAVDSVAVTVNGVDIKESEVDVQLKPQLQKMAAQLPPTFVEQYKKQLRQQVLEGMIVEKLLDEKVKENHIVVTDANVDEHLSQAAAQQNLTLNDIKEMMEARGQNFDEVKQRIKKGLAYQKLMDAQWAGKIKISEEDANKYYSENKAKFEMPEQVRASHILIMPDPNATDPNQAKVKAKAKAEELLKKIKGGDDFAELAKTNSGDTYSAVKGGDLGFFGKGQMVPEFEKAAFALKPGQVSDVVESQFGYHIIKLTDHKDPNTMPFGQAKDDIIKILMQNKQADFAEEYVKSLKAQAKIVYPPGKEPQETPKPTVDSNKPGLSDANKPAHEPNEKPSGKKKASDKKKTSGK